MGEKGSALGNAVIGSFFSTLKRELVNRYSWPTKADGSAAILEWSEVFLQPLKDPYDPGLCEPRGV